MTAGGTPSLPLADLGGRVASLCTPVYRELKEYLGFGSILEHETITMLNTIGEFDEAVLRRLDVGFRRIYVSPPDTFTIEFAENGSFRDEWGIVYRPSGPYVERTGHPLADASLEDLDRFPWPDPANRQRYAAAAARAEVLHRDTEFIVCAGHISAGIFQDCWNLRGMERFLSDMALDTDFAFALLRKVTDFHISVWRELLGRVGAYVDIVETADDLGTQSGLLISPDMYRRMIKPFHTELNTVLHEMTDAKILYHTCGAVVPLIDDLVEAGVDILNPIQPLPGLMDPEILASHFGDRLIFHGGLDVQRLLIEGTPDDIEATVSRYRRVLGHGRYIMAPANTVQPGTRMENLVRAYGEEA